VPFPKTWNWPRISVVVCSYNGARTIRDCLEGLLRLEYPNYEVIVVDDGSTDTTAAIAREYSFRVISTENRGLSNARNTGLHHAKGEIVAYIDDDAYPDPHWLTYLAATFMSTPHVGVGGPNLAPPGDGAIADCVANAPGGPVHVLLSDQEAEHIPGCNMAFRKAALQRIDGFDPQFRTAGDDVDVCWRLQHQGGTLGFSPAAMVWHHRRNSMRAYWRQQRGYARAEALLEKKWPEKYNEAGHLAWSGRLYGKGLSQTLGWRRWRIYQGTWGSALFQSIYQPVPGTLCSLSLMPEWYLVIGVLLTLSALGAIWKPLFLALPLLACAVGLSLVQAGLSAAKASFPGAPPPITQLKLRGLTALLHLLQPLARLYGRLRYGLTPWRWRGRRGLAFPRPRTSTLWSEQWQSATSRLEALEAVLQTDGASVYRGGEFDRWDLEVRGGLFGAVRTLMTLEEHGAGRQLVRFRSWPKCSTRGLLLISLFAVLAAGAMFDHAWHSAALLSSVALLLVSRMFQECAETMATVLHALMHLGAGEA
jgi:glycosyltransferase involved in cell wall biosynthesis